MTDLLRPHAHVHFGVFFQGVNHSTIWSDPASGSQTDFESFRQIVQTAERGLFDAFFLGEGLRLREQNGRPARPRRRRTPRRDHAARRARRRHHAHRPRRHPERHVQRPGRPGAPPGEPRPALRRPRRVEHRHHRQRVDRRELPPRRLARPRPALRTAPASSSSWRRRRSGTLGCGIADTATPTPGRASSLVEARPLDIAVTPDRAAAARRAIRCCSRPATPPTAATSPPRTPR